MKVRKHHAEIRALGAEVLAIGQGTGREAADFCGEVGVSFPCVGDPDRESYRAYGLERTHFLSMILKPFVTAPALAWRRSRRANLDRARSPHSDVLQLPGVIVVDTQGMIRFQHRSVDTDDFPEIRLVMDALHEARTPLA